MGTNHKIHIGFLFHVNFYHSDLGDTNDNRGFGRDLSMIRKILEILGKANNEGQPVQAAWDFENEYTLGRILPSLGPDVIDSVKTRLRERGDELLMSGMHGELFAGMTKKELQAAIRRIRTGRADVLAGDDINNVKNPANILGDPSDVMCPQDFVFSPSIISWLKSAGIRAVLLGNSSIEPDALTFVSADLRKSILGEYNPVTYRHANSSMTMIPVYSPGDLLSSGSFTCFLNELHEKQIAGEINGDLLIMIGADARSAWWDSMDIRNLFGTIPGTEGLSGFLKELRKLSYVAYDTPGNYIKNHEPAAEFSFAGDVAAGNTGDLSLWGELPSNRVLWTRLERARNSGKVYASDRISVSIGKRIELLSSYNFGKAVPAPEKERFAAAEKLSLEIQKIERRAVNAKEMSMRTSGRQRLNNSAIGKHCYSRRKDDEERNTFIIMNILGQRTVSFQLSIEKGQCPKVSSLILECDECKIDSYTAVEMKQDEGFITSVFVIMRFAEAQGTYKIYYHFDRKDLPKPEHKPLLELKPEEIPVFHAEGAMKRLLEAQGKLKKPEEPKEETNPAVAERIAAMSQGVHAAKPTAALANMEKETYLIESPGKKLKVVVNGTGAGKGRIREVFYGEEKIGDSQFLTSYVKCNGVVTEFNCTGVSAAEMAGTGDGVRITGEIHIQGENSPGRYVMQIISTNALKGLEGIFIHMDVQYPQVAMQDRHLFQEIAPMQISPLYRAGVSVMRESFTKNLSEYPVSCFGKSMKGANIITFNNQITGGIVGIKGALSGLMLGHARSVLGSMAMCPGRLETDAEGQHLSLNPYGTYGKPERSVDNPDGGLIRQYCNMMVREELDNQAIAYSGVREKFCMCLTAFGGASINENQLSELVAFSDGAVICGDEVGVIHPFEEDNTFIPREQREVPVGIRERTVPQELKPLKAEIARYFNNKRKNKQ